MSLAYSPLVPTNTNQDAFPSGEYATSLSYSEIDEMSSMWPLPDRKASQVWQLSPLYIKGVSLHSFKGYLLHIVKMLMQVVYLSSAALERYRNSGCLPADGAFIKEAHLPSSGTLGDLFSSLTKDLVKLEDYRAKVRRISPRNGTVRNIYVQWAEGAVSQLMTGDSVVANGQVRLKPMENTCLPRMVDETPLGNLPPTVIEALGGATAAMDSETMASLQMASTTVAAQYASRPVHRVFLEVDGWS